jgi:hypothetical protein
MNLEDQSVVWINMALSDGPDTKEIHELLMENRRKFSKTNTAGLEKLRQENAK